MKDAETKHEGNPENLESVETELIEMVRTALQRKAAMGIPSLQRWVEVYVEAENEMRQMTVVCKSLQEYSTERRRDLTLPGESLDDYVLWAEGKSPISKEFKKDVIVSDTFLSYLWGVLKTCKSVGRMADVCCRVLKPCDGNRSFLRSVFSRKYRMKKKTLYTETARKLMCLPEFDAAVKRHLRERCRLVLYKFEDILGKEVVCRPRINPDDGVTFRDFLISSVSLVNHTDVVIDERDVPRRDELLAKLREFRKEMAEKEDGGVDAEFEGKYQELDGDGPVELRGGKREK